jgi:rsbT co-antagonist protein RsbR
MDVAMPLNMQSPIFDAIVSNEPSLLDGWTREQLDALSARQDLIFEPDLRLQSSRFIQLLSTAIGADDADTDFSAPHWKTVMEFLAEISRDRALQGFSPTETATFIFSLKQPLFSLLRKELISDPTALGETLWTATVLLDKLGLYTTEVFQTSREKIIKRQQAELLVLSTPVVKLWDGILAVPLLGAFDNERVESLIEILLNTIADTASDIAIVDITGVPIVDTMVAKNLLKMVSATKLMGAQCVISGIRPEIARTMVQMNVDLGDVVTVSTLAAALAYAFRRIGVKVVDKASMA